MSLDVRPEIDVFGLVRTRYDGRAWVVGEPYPHGRVGTQLLRKQWLAGREGRRAILTAVERARLLADTSGLPGPAIDALGGFSTPYARDVVGHVTGFPTMLPFLRGAAGVSRSELAELAGVRRETIYRIETRRRGASTEMIVRLMRALG